MYHSAEGGGGVEADMGFRNFTNFHICLQGRILASSSLCKVEFIGCKTHLCGYLITYVYRDSSNFITYEMLQLNNITCIMSGVIT